MHWAKEESFGGENFKKGYFSLNLNIDAFKSPIYIYFLEAT